MKDARQFGPEREADKDDAVFDSFADAYDETHRRNLGLLGRDLDFFACHKVNLAASLAPSRVFRLLEFGCGTGRNLPHLRAAFPEAELYGCDISEASLVKAADAEPGATLFLSPTAEALEAHQGAMDMVFTANVLHHIPASGRQEWMVALAATLRPQGRLIIFEHNPMNPLTRYFVSTCPFDVDAELVWPGTCRALVRSVGLEADRARYTLLFPWRSSLLQAVEKFFDRIPLGGQYCLVSRRCRLPAARSFSGQGK